MIATSCSEMRLIMSREDICTNNISRDVKKNIAYYNKIFNVDNNFDIL